MTEVADDYNAGFQTTLAAMAAMFEWFKPWKKVYAMKTLSKWDMLKRANVACFREGN